MAGDDVDDARDLRRARIGPANELHHELAHVLVVGTPRHRRREHCAELGHLGVPRLDLRLEHLGMHLELLGTPSEARVVSRVIDGIRAPQLFMLPLQLAELSHGDSGAPRVEIGVAEPPRVDRPPLLQLPQLFDKAIHLRHQLAVPAFAHAIEELDELLAALPEHCGLSTCVLPDEVLRRVEAPQLGDRLALGVDDLLLEPARIERPVGGFIPQLLLQALDPLLQRLLHLLVRLLRLELLGLVHFECRREPHVEVSLESTSMRLPLTQLPH